MLSLFSLKSVGGGGKSQKYNKVPLRIEVLSHKTNNCFKHFHGICLNRPGSKHQYL